jgi:hypothetical protein
MEVAKNKNFSIGEVVRDVGTQGKISVKVGKLREYICVLKNVKEF